MKDPLEYSVEELNSLSTDELKELYHDAQMKEDEYHTAQLCKKVTINSLYGALGNAYFPLFNQEIAQAITGNGRFYIQHTANLIEETLQQKIPSKIKYIVYGDTDSAYFQIKPYVDLFSSKNANTSLKDKIDFCKKFMEKVIQPIIDKSNDLAYTKLNGFNRERIQAKNEVICDSAVLCAKKKYYARVRVDEGTEFPLDNPHIKVMGLELAKSTTPEWVKKKLNEAIPIILDSSTQEIKDWVQRVKKEYTSAPLSEIAMVGSASKLDYNLSEKGVPFGSRIAIVYNNYVKKNNLENRFPLITEGAKHQRMFLTTPNKFNTECIAYVNDDFAEKELKNLVDLVDYDTQFKKSFLASLQLMIDCLGIDILSNNESLDDW